MMIMMMVIIDNDISIMIICNHYHYYFIQIFHSSIVFLDVIIYMTVQSIFLHFHYFIIITYVLLPTSIFLCFSDVIYVIYI